MIAHYIYTRSLAHAFSNMQVTDGLIAYEFKKIFDLNFLIQNALTIVNF
jgi:hypothetical protein